MTETKTTLTRRPDASSRARHIYFGDVRMGQMARAARIAPYPELNSRVSKFLWNRLGDSPLLICF